MPPLPRPTVSSVTRSSINRVTANSMEPRGCLAHYDRGSRPLYDPLHHSVGARHPGGIGRSHIQIAAAPVPGGLRQYGRRLWHEGRLLSGICAVALGIRGHRTSGPLDRRAQRRVVERRAGARQRCRDRAGARQGRAVSGAARAVESGDRRLFFDRPPDDTADDRARLPGQYLRHPGGSCASRRGADQYDEHCSLPRRQPARADLCDRDDHRQGRARARHRARRTAPPQYDPGRGDAVHDGIAANL